VNEQGATRNSHDEFEDEDALRISTAGFFFVGGQLDRAIETSINKDWALGGLAAAATIHHDSSCCLRPIIL